MTAPADVAAEFVRSYYTKLVFQPAEIPKFYDEEHATIWRTDLQSPLAAPFADARDFLVPRIEDGSTVSVSAFHVLPLDKGFSLVAEGAIARGDACHFFTQFFTFGCSEGRFFIIADSLTIRAPDHDPPRTDELALVRPARKAGREGEPRPPKSGKRSAKGKEDRFHYVPDKPV
jgi:hypothetical protein